MAKKPVRSFVSSSDFDGSRHGIECALSRLAAQGELAHVRKGLYWKGPKTRLGLTPPRPLAVALHLGGLGSGPAGFTAASVLGLTTQVPATLEIALPGRHQRPPAGVRFTLRHPSRRDHRLSHEEVALIEVLRDWPATVESGWDELVSRARELVADKSVRPAQMTKQANIEHRPAIREGWLRLQQALAT